MSRRKRQAGRVPVELREARGFEREPQSRLASLVGVNATPAEAWTAAAMLTLFLLALFL